VVAEDSREWGSLKAYAKGNSDPIVICQRCSLPQGTDPTPPDMNWSSDGRFVYLKFAGSTYAIPLAAGRVLPPIPPSGFESKEMVETVAGAQLVSTEANVFPGPNPRSTRSPESRPAKHLPRAGAVRTNSLSARIPSSAG
jgi:hypothetical protein